MASIEKSTLRNPFETTTFFRVKTKINSFSPLRDRAFPSFLSCSFYVDVRSATGFGTSSCFRVQSDDCCLHVRGHDVRFVHSVRSFVRCGGTTTKFALVIANAIVFASVRFVRIPISFEIRNDPDCDLPATNASSKPSHVLRIERLRADRRRDPVAERGSRRRRRRFRRAAERSIGFRRSVRIRRGKSRSLRLGRTDRRPGSRPYEAVGTWAEAPIRWTERPRR